MNNDFAAMYRRQKHFITETLGLREFAPLTKEYVLRLQVEVCEVYNAAKLKQLNPTFTPEEREKLLEELVDCQKYLFNLFVVNRFSSEDIVRKFHEKSTTVEQRAKVEKWYQDTWPNPT